MLYCMAEEGFTPEELGRPPEDFPGSDTGIGRCYS
jgi:hypothetical protein